MLRRRGRARKSLRSTPLPPPPPPQTLPPAVIELACLCGQLLRVAREAMSYLCSCPGCRRRFFISLTKDRKSGQEMAVPVYVAEKGAPVPPQIESVDSEETGSTRVAEKAVDGEAEIGEPIGMDALSDHAPEPPTAMFFICVCGQKLIARKEMYDRRIRCPYCNERLLLTLVYDPGAKTFDLKTMRISGPSQGDTWQLDKE